MVKQLSAPRIKFFQIAVVGISMFLVTVMAIVTFVAQTRVHGRVHLDAAQVQMLRQKAADDNLAPSPPR